MDTFLRDIRYSVRHLRNSPAFTAIVLLTLALGIGANTAIFTVVNAVLLRPLPYSRPEQLVTINHFYRSPELNNLEAPVSSVGFRDYRDKTTSFESVAVETGFAANLTGTGDPERIPATRVSGLYFKVHGVPAQLGRTFQPDEDEPGKNRVIVISDGLWKRVFGGEKSVINKTVELNSETYTIVGVMPPEFKGFFSRNADIWTPLALPATAYNPQGYTNEYLNLTARLKPNVTLEKASAEMTAFAEQLKRLYPDNLGPRWTLKVTSLNGLATNNIRPALLVLLGAVGFVLLIACANVANLLLARAAVRMKEIAIRAALGADRRALVRQLLTESVMLAVGGGIIGLGIAYYSVKSLVVLVPSLPQASAITLDPAVLAFSFALSVFTGLLFGVAPALQTSHVNLQHTLKEGGRTGAADFSGRTLRRVLVVGEVALALTLLTGAGLLIKSVARLQGVDPGFRPDNLLTFTVAIPRAKFPSDTVRTQFFGRAIDAVAAVPGATGVAVTSVMPFGGSWSTGSFQIEGVTQAQGQPSPWGDQRWVNEGFFKTMGVTLKSGRVFEPQDDIGSARVAIVDEEFVKKYSREQNPIGRRIYFGGPPGPNTQYVTIVGVVNHTSHEGLDADPRLQVYRPYRQSTGNNALAFAVRTTGDPLKMVNAVRQAIRSVDRDIPISGIKSMDDLIEGSMGQRRLSMILLGSFAAIAILLAAIGIYGVMSHFVTQRTRELGIRMALGANRGRVLGLVVGQGMSLAVTGVVLGVAGAFGLTRFLTAQLYQVQATDPSTFVVVASGLTGIAMLAVLLPALRATRVDPVVALRQD